MPGSATEEYLLELYTKDHRIFLARVDGTAYLLEQLEQLEDDGHRLVNLCVQAIFEEIREPTLAFLEAYESLPLEERLGPALCALPDPLSKEKRYFGSIEEAHQKLFVWPLLRPFYSEAYSELVTKEWSRVLPASDRGRIWDQRLIKRWAARHLPQEEYPALAELDLYAAFPDYVCAIIPRTTELARSHREPLRFVTRRYDIGDGIPTREPG